MATSQPKRNVVSDTETKAKKARGETDLGCGLEWREFGTPLTATGMSPLFALISDDLDGATNIASFDVDSTIITTESGKKFAVGSNDWMFWDETIPKKLKALHEEGFRIVFFTNQAAIEKGHITAESFRNKMEDIVKELDIPIFVFVSTGKNHYRKPSPTMWNTFVDECNKDVQVNKALSFYVGDAAGRPKNWSEGKPKDFSCSDRMFAHNIGINFYTPEEFFLQEAAVPFDWRSLDPIKFLKANPPVSKTADKASYHSTSQELVVMVGQPSSGKSTFSRRYFAPHGYVIVNRDTMGTVEKCLKVGKEALKAGQSVVCDNTNSSVSARVKFVNLAKAAGVPCRCIWMKTPIDLSHHLNLFREGQTKGKVCRVPDVAYHVFNKNFEEPTKAEGFSDVLVQDFKCRFDSKADEEMFKHWTI